MSLAHYQSFCKGLLLLCLCLLATPAFNQYYILGRGLDDDEVPYAHALAKLTGEDYSSQQITTEQGVFRFENLKPGAYELILITPYGIRRKKIQLRGSIDLTLHIARNIQMDEISVIANRAGSDEPVTHDDLSKEEINNADTGKDMPYLLEMTPSVVTTSDAGTGIGYSGLRIRGTDPTRINVTLNGIPVNDAESQAVFWVDLPDIASSTTNIQVQRGLGWSQPGTGDFGGAVNVNTMGFHFKPYGEVKLGAGSFNTQRGTLALGSGLINGRFTVDARGSYIQSDGYIDRAESKLYSIYASAGYHHDANNIRLVVAHGDELTYQAWNGVPEQYIKFNPSLRTYNSAGAEKPGTPHDNEVDDYRQTHMQLHFDQAITPFARLTTALHYTLGKGFFEQYKADQYLAPYGHADTTIISDLIRRRWLDNDFYGFTSTLHFGKPGERYFLLGGGLNKYEGLHFGEVIWTEENVPLDLLAPYYENEAVKKDGNVFARTNMKLGEKLDATLDLQGRWIRYTFLGPNENGTPTDQTVRHSFFNPKIGFTYALSEKSSLYLLSGLNHKEPNRDDYVESTPLSRPDAERLWDTELGFRILKEKWKLSLNGYYMLYKDQIVPTGRLNDVGAYTRVNVEESHRVGAEIALSTQILKNLALTIHATASDNRIKSFDEYIDNWTTGAQEVVSHKNTNLAFSPKFISSAYLDYTIISKPKWKFSIDLNGRYVGKQYVDNTSNEGSELESYFVSDGGLKLSFFPKFVKEISLGFKAYNLFDAEYESNGWIYRFISEDYNPVPDDPYAGSEGGDLYHLRGYYPQAFRHFMVQLNVTF